MNQIGTIIVPLTAGLVIDNLGWKWIFVVGAILNLTSAIVMLPIPDPPLQKKQGSFDYFGSLTLMLCVTCFCIACTVLANSQYVAFAIMTVLFVVFLVLFLFVEKRHKDPILPLKIMKNPVSDMFFQNILDSGVQNGFAWLLPQLLNNSTLSGTVSSVTAGLTLLASILGPIITKKMVNWIFLTIDYTAIIVMIVVILFCLSDTTAYIITNSINTFLVSFLLMALYPMMMVAVPHRYVASISGVPTMSRTIGSSIANCIFSSILSMVYNQAIKKNDEKASMVKGAQACFITAIVLLLLGLLDTVFRLGNTRSEKGKCGYKESKVRELNDDDNEIESGVGMKVSKEQDALLETEPVSK